MSNNPKAKEAKSKANVDFKEGKWADAIKSYSKAIKLEPNDYICIANRSAAYLKKGDADQALVDAEMCVKLKPTYSKGHVRKAGALHALKKFTAEVKAYQYGLECCPGDKVLIQGLDQARRRRTTSSKASKAARRTQATKQAAKSVRKKSKKATGVSQFVQQTKKNLELQMAAIQAQLDMVKELSIMKLDEKLDLLYTLMDTDGDGTINAAELAEALRKRNDGLSFGDSIQKAIEFIAIYDDDGDAELDRDEFRHFIQRITEELHATIDEFCEFLVFQILFSKDDGTDEEETVDKDQLKEQVQEKEQLLQALSSPRMLTLFKLFDKDGDETVSFEEAACGLYHLTKNMEDSAKATTGLLLMMDKNDQRVLEFEQFAKLILAIAAAAGTGFEEVADDLTLALTQPGASDFDEEIIKTLTIADEEYNMARDRGKGQKSQDKKMNALSYGRTLRLFDLWDANGDGTIDFDELFAGLQLYQDAAAKETGKDIDVEQVTATLMAMDVDGSQSLDKEEFTSAMVLYAEAMETDLHQLIDFMCVVTALGEHL